MKVIDFGDASCRRTREYLDCYLSHELLAETNLDVQRHLDACPECERAFGETAGIRRILRDAVRGERSPGGLPERVRVSLLKVRRNRRRVSWGLAMVASVLLLFAAGWPVTVYVSGHAPHELIAQERYITSLAESVGAVTFLGLSNHLHCGVYWKILQQDLDDAEILETLGDELAPLAGVVREKLPAGYEVRLAHRCAYRGRIYIHFVARREDDRLVSLVLTERNDGESFRVTDDLRPVSEALGVEIFGSSVDGYHLAGFETDRYLGFVVSDVGWDENLAIAEAVAPEVWEFMSGFEG